MSKTYRINFDEQELVNIDFLLKEQSISTPQKLIRGLIDRETERVRGALRYKRRVEGGGSVSRENKETRLNAMLALPNDALNTELERLHVFEQFKSTSDMRVWVEDDGIGGRIVKYHSPSGGDAGQRSFGDIIIELRKVV